MFAAVTFIMTMIYARNSFDSMVFNLKERETMYAKLAEVDRLVRQKYYNKIDEKNLEEQLVSGYIEGIEDKYGAYLTAEQYSQQQKSTDLFTCVWLVCPAPFSKRKCPLKSAKQTFSRMAAMLLSSLAASW